MPIVASAEVRIGDISLGKKGAFDAPVIGQNPDLSRQFKFRQGVVFDAGARTPSLQSTVLVLSNLGHVYWSPDNVPLHTSIPTLEIPIVEATELTYLKGINSGDIAEQTFRLTAIYLEPGRFVEVIYKSDGTRQVTEPYNPPYSDQRQIDDEGLHADILSLSALPYWINVGRTIAAFAKQAHNHNFHSPVLVAPVFLS